ncbi:MAG: carboxypeptidase-like regulatory domain-containing protein, partial [Bryobacteraceae bacterium]
TGGAVPQAKVEIVNVATNDTVKSGTNAMGYFEFPYLKPGSYKVRVSAAGFKTMERAKVDVQVDARVRLDFQLELGDVQTTVSVSEAVLPIQTDSASLGKVVTDRTIRELPVLGRNVFELAGLVAGVQANSRVSEGQVVAEGDFGSAPSVPTLMRQLPRP